MKLALKQDFSEITQTPGGLGRDGIFSQCVLYPARENHTREKEMRNAATLAIEMVREQVEKTYTTCISGKIFDLNVRLLYSDEMGSAEVIITCTDSLDKAVQKIKRGLFQEQHSLIENAL